MSEPLRAALAQYPLTRHASFDEYARHLETWVEAGSAQLLVFPEYAGMDLVSLLPQPLWADEVAQLEAIQPLLPAYLDLHAGLARRWGVYLLAGSLPVQEAGQYFNRAYLFSPDGDRGFQDKLVLTPSEVASSGLTVGQGAKVFHTELGTLAVNICYDAEFPAQARAQALAGAELLLVPSCTSNRRGAHRVRVGAMARALENQLFALTSPLVGESPWLAGLERSCGLAGAYTPSDEASTGSLPEDGILAQAASDALGWLYAELDVDLLRAVRREGHVRGLEDYAQAERTQAAEVIRL